MLVNFFVVGVQKGGTTALDTMLRKHPAIQMASVKEVHFFDNEAVDWANPDYRLLHRNFDWSARPAMRGETTPIYIYWPRCLERLQAYNPYARLVLGLRHPSLRAFSHWKMERQRLDESLTFSDAIRSGRSRVADAENAAHRVHSYVERGFYHIQISRLLTLFPREQIHFFRTDHLWTDPKGSLAAIQDFLSVPRRLTSERSYIVPLESNQTLTMAPDDRLLLDDLYKSSIEAAARLTGLDLSDWLQPGYLEPMTPDA